MLNSNLISHLDKGYLVITPNQASKNTLMKHYMQFKGMSISHANLITLDNYIDDIIKTSEYPLLDTAMEAEIWYSIDKNIPIGAYQQTRKNLQMHCIDLITLKQYENQEQHFGFSSFLEKFQQKITDLDLYTLEDILIKTQRAQDKYGVYLWNFTSPILPLFNHILSQSFAHVSYSSYPKHPLKNITLFSFTEEDEELKAVSQWAKKILRHDLDARIAIVDTSNKLHADIQRELEYIAAHRTTLRHTSALSCALDIFSLNQTSIPKECLQRLIASPLCCTHKTLEERVQLEKRLDRHEKIIPIDVAQKLLHIPFSIINTKLPIEDMALRLIEQLDYFWRNHHDNPIQGTSEDMQSILNIINNTKELGSLKKQLYLDDYVRFIKNKSIHLQSHIMYPSNINIVHTTSSAQGFDYVWLVSVDKKNWPAPTLLSSLLPAKLQLDFNFPKTNTALEYEICKSLIHDLDFASKQFVCSFIKKNLVSSILDHIEIEEFYLDHIQTPLDLHVIDISTAPPVNAPYKISIAAIEAQSSCPLQAFLTYRLGAKTKDIVNIGFNPIDKGIVLHDCLEYIWQELKNNHALQNITDKKLHKLIQDSLIKSLDTGHSILQSSLTDQYSAYLYHAIKYEQEYRITECFEVHDTEYEIIYTTENSAKITLRIDRVDKLSSGQYRIIDYKTGIERKIRSIKDRPVGIQMYLYGCALEQNGFNVSTLDLFNITHQSLKGPTIHTIAAQDITKFINPIIREYLQGITENTIYHPHEYQAPFKQSYLDLLRAREAL